MTSASILSDNGTFKRSRRCVSVIAVAASVFLTPLLGFAGLAQAQAQQKPNIIFIMGDDIGWSNIGVYNQGIMAGRTPNLNPWRRRARGSPTTTPKRAARLDAQTSSPGNYRSARD